MAEDFDLFAYLVERRIREAMEKGEFDNLPGAGKPLKLEDPPPGVSRETWLMMSILRNSKVAPREVQLLKEVRELREQLASAKTETERVERLKALRFKEAEALNALEQFQRSQK